MDDIEKRLNARITAQDLIINALLDAAIKSGQLDVRALVESLERFVDSPTAPAADPVEIEAVKSEVEGWADMLFDCYWPDNESVPERSRT